MFSSTISCGRPYIYMYIPAPQYDNVINRVARTHTHTHDNRRVIAAAAVWRMRTVRIVCRRPSRAHTICFADVLPPAPLRSVRATFHPFFPSILFCQQTAVVRKMVLTLEKPAPQFKGTAVINGDFKEISLDSFKGKYVVLFFYPLDFTFVCPTEIIAFSDRADEFAAIKCQLIAASCDSHFSHLAWVNTPRNEGGLGKMQIPLLADKSASIAKDYQVYNEATGIPYRGLFIIDGKGNLRQITINDLPVGRSVDETLRLVQAFQYTDEHGEVCPANWKPGSKTINPAKSKDYFKTVE